MTSYLNVIWALSGFPFFLNCLKYILPYLKFNETVKNIYKNAYLSAFLLKKGRNIDHVKMAV